jgi:polysaccharide biosynthesis/export protein
MFRTLLATLFAVLLAPVAFAQGSYRIQTGDVLQFEVLEDNTLNRSLLVLPDGTISVPLAGSVAASGQSLDSVRSAIAAALASNFATTPTVFLSIGQISPANTAAATAATAAATAFQTPIGAVTIYTVGEVNKPGKIDVKAGTTLLQFLAESGGLTKFAATKRIQLRRADRTTGLETVYQYNYKSVQAGAKSPVIVLRSGDVIVVPERKLFE